MLNFPYGHFPFGFDLAGTHYLLSFDFGFLYLTFSQNSRGFCFTTSFSFNSSNTGTLLCRTGFYPLLLLQSHEGFLLFNLQTSGECIPVFFPDGHFNILLNFVAFAATTFCFLGQKGQAFSIKGIVRIKMYPCSLVETCQRHTFKLQTVFG
ncbi:Uncharacterised protein [Klebsiella pneumoniae]|nr:Uncharacterised protein [Shigella sonnei]SWO58074.1 Uncharacterised protein [Klebsiella pneumoniae]